MFFQVFASRAVAPTLAYYTHQLSPFILRFNDHAGLRWYGFAYVLAFVCGYWLLQGLAQQGYGELPPAKVADFITLAAIFGVMLGGRLGWIVFYGWSDIRADPWNALKLWQGGMSSHGGILGLVIFTWVYARVQKISWPGLGIIWWWWRRSACFSGGWPISSTASCGAGSSRRRTHRPGHALSERARRAVP